MNRHKIAVLLVLAIAFVAGLYLGVVYNCLGAVEHQIAANPLNSTQVYGVFTGIHYGVILILALAMLGVVDLAKRVCWI